MVKALLRIYVAFRHPRYFLMALCTFIAVSLFLHYTRGYDADWGGTNLTLSIEASVASAVLMKIAEESAEWTRRMLQAILDLTTTLREMMVDHRALMLEIKAQNEQILQALKDQK